MQVFADIDYWIVALTTLLVVVLCVFVHFLVLGACNRRLPHFRHARRRALVLVFAVLAAHTVEVWLFAFAYFGLAVAGSGELISSTLVGEESTVAALGEYVYFSAMVFTTVGFGDVVPVGPIRFLAGMEGLAGLVLIAWSASFTYLEMQRNWPDTRA